MYFISLEKASERLVCLLNSFENTFICSRTAFYVGSNKRFNFITHQSKKNKHCLFDHINHQSCLPLV